jgi:uncharacterized protein HemX
MKRIAAFVLLAVLILAGAIPTQAQRISPQQNARRSKKEINNHQKLLKKANKKQARAMKKYAKQQRKATARANRNLKRRKG